MFESDGLSQTLAERVAASLAQRIASGEFKPGERLIEATMAKSMQVSHGPIRDALRLLHSAGIVTISPYKGACVTALTQQELYELFQVRAALAGLRARWLAQDPDRHSKLASLEEPIARLIALGASRARSDRFVATALEISNLLTEQIANRWLRSMMQALSLQTSRYARTALSTPEGRLASARSWRKLLDLIREGDAVRAEALASQLTTATYDAALASLKPDGSKSGRG